MMSLTRPLKGGELKYDSAGDIPQMNLLSMITQLPLVLITPGFTTFALSSCHNSARVIYSKTGFKKGRSAQ